MMKKTEVIRVLVADDHAVVRQGLVALINRRRGMRCKTRGFCPSYSAKRSLLWGQFVREKVLANCSTGIWYFRFPDVSLPEK